MGDRIYSFTKVEVFEALTQYAISRGEPTPYDCDLEHAWSEGTPTTGLRIGIPRKSPTQPQEKPPTQ